MYLRRLNIIQNISESSIFLLGPRQTGKSTLLRTLFPSALYLDLLQLELFVALAKEPSSLEGIITKAYQTKEHDELKIIIINEIQKLPVLLDEVHRIIEKDKNTRYILTGCSARKLKSSHVNLLGGRADLHHLFPLDSKEVETWPIKKNMARPYGGRRNSKYFAIQQSCAQTEVILRTIYSAENSGRGKARSKLK